MIGVILAGGRSSRMGVDKATYAVAGRPMIDWVVDALSRACHRVVVAGRYEAPAGLEAIPDEGDGPQGPLAGLVSCLRHFPNESLIVVAVDQPWLRTDTVKRLGELAGDLPVVPVEGGVRQTTCALYPPGVADAGETELKTGGSLQSLLDVVAFAPVVDWHEWGEDGRSWFSVDTPQAAEEGLARFGLP